MTKQSTLTVLCFLITLNLFGQNQSTSKEKYNESIYSRRLSQRAQLSNNKQPYSLIAEDTEKHKLDSIIEFNLNETTQNWDVRFRKMEYQYDQSFHEILYFLYAWSEQDRKWKNLRKDESSYDEKGNISEYTEYTWSVNNEWSPLYKETYHYGSDNLLSEIKNYVWKYSRKEWLIIQKVICEYDDNNNPNIDTYYQWSESSGLWEPDKKVVHDYKNGYKEFETSMEWDSDKNEWIYHEKKNYLYKLDQILYAIDVDSWNSIRDDWKDKSLTGFAYDEQKNYYSKRASVINEDDENQWDEVSWELYTHNFDIASDGLIVPWIQPDDRKFFHHEIKNKLLYSYDRETKKWRQYRQVDYYFSPASPKVVTGLEDIENKVTVYPNPARDYLKITYPESFGRAIFRLSDMQGREIISRTMTSGDQADISQLKSGVYYYTLHVGGTIISNKLIVE